MSKSRRLYAIIPAAGHSRRMGKHKLLLDVDGKTVIKRLLDVLHHKSIAERVVVVRGSDTQLILEVVDSDGTPVIPSSDPIDMRSSVEYGLRYLDHRGQCTIFDGWLLLPADHPMLDTTVLDDLIRVWMQNPERIIVPTHDERRGHPTIFPWRFAEAVKNLPQDSGLNLLLQQNQEIVCEVPVESFAVVTDLDTPEEYEALLRQFRDHLGS